MCCKGKSNWDLDYAPREECVGVQGGPRNSETDTTYWRKDRLWNGDSPARDSCLTRLLMCGHTWNSEKHGDLSVNLYFVFLRPKWIRPASWKIVRNLLRCSWKAWEVMRSAEPSLLNDSLDPFIDIEKQFNFNIRNLESKLQRSRLTFTVQSLSLMNFYVWISKFNAQSSKSQTHFWSVWFDLRRSWTSCPK